MYESDKALTRHSQNPNPGNRQISTVYPHLNAFLYEKYRFSGKAKKN